MQMKCLFYPVRFTALSQTIRMTELIDQSLWSFRLLHDTFLVVLPNRTRQLVVVHRRPVLAPAPQSGHAHRVLDLEHALAAVQPPDGAAVLLCIGEQLLEELPQMNVCATLAAFFCQWRSNHNGSTRGHSSSSRSSSSSTGSSAESGQYGQRIVVVIICVARLFGGKVKMISLCCVCN